MASTQLTEAPADQRNLVESLGQLDIGKEETVGYNAGLAKPRSGGLARTSSTASSTTSSSSSEAGETTPQSVPSGVEGSEAKVSDGLVQKKPPTGLLQSVAGKISQTVTSAKDAIVGKKETAVVPPQSTGSITGRAAAEGEDVLELDSHNKDKVGDQVYSTAGAKEALASAGAAIASSAVAAKDAVVGAVSSTGTRGAAGDHTDLGTAHDDPTASPTGTSKPGILQTVGTKIASSAQYVKEALVTGKPAAATDSAAGEAGEGEVASPTASKGILAKVGEKVSQSAQYIKQSVQSKAVTDPANPEKVNVPETAKAALKAVGDKVSEGSAYVRDAALTKAGPYSQSSLEPPPETGIINPTPWVLTSDAPAPADHGAVPSEADTHPMSYS